MADDPAPKRVRRAIGTVCEACGKHFATSDGFDKHRTSGYLVGTPCHVLDDGSTRAQLVATSRQTMSTAMLQTLKLARRTHGTTSYPKKLSKIRKISLLRLNPGLPFTAGTGFSLIKLIILKLLIFLGMYLAYLGIT